MQSEVYISDQRIRPTPTIAGTSVLSVRHEHAGKEPRTRSRDLEMEDEMPIQVHTICSFKTSNPSQCHWRQELRLVRIMASVVGSYPSPTRTDEVKHYSIIITYIFTPAILEAG
jgi:hypothetical protein